jgi:hypothetical protein
VALDDTAAKLQALAVRLREAGDTGLLREMQKALRDAADPVPEDIRRGLRPKLPNRYADVLNADLDIRIETRSTANEARVSVTASTPSVGGRPSRRGRSIRRLDSGILWHPVFARGPRRSWDWREQAVQPGFFSQPARDDAPRARAEMDAALERVRQKIEGHG